MCMRDLSCDDIVDYLGRNLVKELPLWLTNTERQNLFLSQTMQLGSFTYLVSQTVEVGGCAGWCWFGTSAGQQ